MITRTTKGMSTVSITESIDLAAEIHHHTIDGDSWPNFRPYTAPTTHYPCRICGTPIHRTGKTFHDSAQPIPHTDESLAIAGELGAGKWIASRLFRELASYQRARLHPRTPPASPSIAVTTFPPSPPRLASARPPQPPHDEVHTQP